MKTYKVIGLMSGTSLDGLDIAYCHIWKSSVKWEFEIIRTHSIEYSSHMREDLKNAIHLSAENLLELNTKYGIWLGQKTKDFITNYKLEVDFVASHGHTTHHRPEKGFTYQIGSGQYLANESGHHVVCDFRNNDVALGGQGAPLVPIGDSLFFNEFEFCLNLGGISNISFEKESKRVAYDVGLANMVLNHITEKIDLAYDKGGQLASKGFSNNSLLKELNGLDYYKLPFPKSTGYEWFVEKVVPILNKYDDGIENMLHTCIHHLCEQVSIQIMANLRKSENTLFVTGGGALNDFMMNVLRDKLEPIVKVHIPPKKLIEFKEALVFALMGVLKMENEVNVLSTVTGASRDSINGVSYFPS